MLELPGHGSGTNLDSAGALSSQEPVSVIPVTGPPYRLGFPDPGGCLGKVTGACATRQIREPDIVDIGSGVDSLWTGKTAGRALQAARRCDAALIGPSGQSEGSLRVGGDRVAELVEVLGAR